MCAGGPGTLGALLPFGDTLADVAAYTLPWSRWVRIGGLVLHSVLVQRAVGRRRGASCRLPYAVAGGAGGAGWWPVRAQSGVGKLDEEAKFTMRWGALVPEVATCGGDCPRIYDGNAWAMGCRLRCGK